MPVKKAKNPPGAVQPDLAEEARLARQVLEAESAAIQRIKVDGSFHDAVSLITRCVGSGAGADETRGQGSVVVSGMGKSGLVGQKISATLASTGAPSHFLHPTEAMHGDLGRIRRGDLVLVLSFGGSTDEVVSLATILKQDGVPVISMVGRAGSPLARLSTVVLSVGDVAEACPLNLAPTASTTAMLALGDALALCVSRRRNFGVEEFRRVHPAGALGRQLMPVVQAMRFRVGHNLVLVPQDVTIERALRAEVPGGGRRAGAVLVIDGDGKLVGILTDGDLRRQFTELGGEALGRRIDTVMTKAPRYLTDQSLVRDAVQLVRELRIDEVPVIDGHGRPLGMLDVQDLIALKVIEE